MFAAIAILGLIVSMILLRIGLRGRRIDDHPLCRACGFDLTGKPDSSTQCAECGTDVSRAGNVRIGHRERRSGFLMTGATGLGLCALLLGAIIWGAVNHVDWQSQKPTWWLLSDAGSSSFATYSPAMNELISRNQNGQLNAAQSQRLVQRILAIQKNTALKWDGKFGDFLERQHAARTLGKEDYSTYARQGIQITLEVRPRVRRGDPIMVWVGHTGRYGSGFGSLWFQMVTSENNAKFVDDLRIPEKDFGGGGGSLGSGGMSRYGSPVKLDQIVEKLSDGPHTFRRKMQIEFRDGSYNGPVVTSMLADISAPFTLQPADQPTVTINNDEKHRAAIEKAIILDTGPGSAPEWRSGPNYSYLSMSVRADVLPVGVSYHVKLKSGDKIVDLGRLSHPGNAASQSWALGGTVREYPGEKVDVIFEPDVLAAIESSGTFEMWNFPIVIKDVKIANLAPATRPVN